jgi:hypothetical protein
VNGGTGTRPFSTRVFGILTQYPGRSQHSVMPPIRARCRFATIASTVVRARGQVALALQSQAHRGPFAQDWNGDSKNRQSRPNCHALRCSENRTGIRPPDSPSKDVQVNEGMHRRHGDVGVPLPACVWNKFDDPSVDPCRPRTMHERAASLSCELRAYGCMVRKTESESPLPHETPARPI